MISLSDHFNFRRIFNFVISPMLMMIFISMYGIVDGYFISNYTSLDAYAGVNLIMPIIMVVGGLGFMFGTGGSALSSKLLGEGNKSKANKVFTMMLLIDIIVGVSISIVGFLLIKPIANAMGRITDGSTQGMVEQAIKYGRILSLGQVFFMIQNLFHSYFVVDEKPKLGFLYTLLAGFTNIILDFLFIKIFKWGVVGAAVATISGYIVGSVFPLIHFIKNKNGNINLEKTKIEFKVIKQSCFNGSSEFVNNISSSIVGLVFNIQLLKYYGQDGISAYGTLMYVSFIFVAIFIGYSIGMAPIIGFNYGAQNKKELRNVLLRSIVIISFFAVVMLVLGELLGPQFSKLYIKNDEELLNLTIFAFRIFSIHFLFCGFTIFLSSFFTALNNGLISAVISFMRTIVFQITFVIVIPLIFGKEGIWWSIIICEFLALVLAFIFLFVYNKKYGYFKSIKEESVSENA